MVMLMTRSRWILIGITFIGLVFLFVHLIVTFYPRPVTPADIRELSGILASLMDGTRSLNEIIQLAAQQVKNPEIKRTLLSIQRSLGSEPLYKLLANFPNVYPPEFVMAVDYGGKLGKMNIVLRELSQRWPDQPEKREATVKQILKPLALQTLKDESWFYRSYALYVLAMLKCKDAVPQMLPLLQDPDPRVRETAKRALQELGYKVK